MAYSNLNSKRYIFQAETFAKPHFLIVTKHKFLNFQLVIFLEFVNSEILQRFQAA